MRFITRVRVTDFRSISDADVKELDDVVPLVGLNGSGKSNFLRALNLFFNDRLEGDDQLDLRRDFREPGRKAKLRVAVEVELAYDIFEGLRPEYQEALDRLSEGYPVISLKKEWTLHPVTREQVTTFYAGPLTDELKELAPDEVPYATRLLNAIRFRYIPNHIHPTAVLRAESEGIRKLLFDRLGQAGVISSKAVRQIATEAASSWRGFARCNGRYRSRRASDTTGLAGACLGLWPSVAGDSSAALRNKPSRVRNPKRSRLPDPPHARHNVLALVPALAWGLCFSCRY